MSRHPLIKGAAVVAAIASLAGAAIAADVGAPAPPEPAVPSERSAVPITAPDSVQAGTLGVLRRSPEADDTLPAGVRAHLAHGATPDLGANAGLARRALTTPLGEELYVVPARGWVCLTSTAGSGLCTPTDQIAAGYAVSLQQVPAGYRIGGLVPDGVGHVVVRGRDGEGATVAVTGNAWRADVAFAPARVVWAGAAGEASVPVFPAPVTSTAKAAGD